MEMLAQLIGCERFLLSSSNFGILVMRDALAILADLSQVGSDVEPVQHVLGFRGDQLRQSLHSPSPSVRKITS